MLLDEELDEFELSIAEGVELGVGVAADVPTAGGELLFGVGVGVTVDWSTVGVGVTVILLGVDVTVGVTVAESGVGVTVILLGVGVTVGVLVSLLVVVVGVGVGVGAKFSA